MSTRYLMNVLVSAVLAAVTMLPGASRAENNEKAIRDIRKKLSRVKDLAADFKYTAVIKVLDERQVSNGKLYLKKPDRFRIELEYLTLVSDGETVWNYTPENKQVLKSSLEKSPEIPRISNVVFDFEKSYRVDRLRSERKYHVLTLIPREPVADITSLEVWVDKKKLLVRKMAYQDINGNEKIYELSNIKINQKPARDLFMFQVPEGVEVFETR